MASEPDESPSARLLGETVGNRYHVEELLGRGGMGAVYRAEHVHIRKSFALKVLHPELTHHQEAVKRFEREAIAAARISHPNVATAIDFGKLPTGEFYLVLDYVQGRSLRNLLTDEAPLTEVRTIRIARQIAQALGAAHAAGIVHRDLKPDNVMLVESNGAQEFVKVLDFGIAKLRTEDIADEPAITRFGTVFGTPEYMSPEQALGHTVDTRSDLYSLGIMLYEMLTGHTPFADEQLVTVLSRQMTEKPAPLVHVSTDLGALVLALLEKAPVARPESAERIVELLDGIELSLVPAASVASSNRRAVSGPVHSADTILAVAEPDARPHPEPVPAPVRSLYSVPVWAKRQVTIGGRRIPWVLLALGSSLMALTIILTLTVGSLLRTGTPEPEPSSHGSAALALGKDGAEAKRIARQIVLATQGDREALAALQSRPEAASSATLWLAVGAGQATNKAFGPAIEAYRKAFQLDPKVAHTPQTQSALYQAALVPETSERAIELAVTYQGARGADLLYAVRETTLQGTPSKLDRRMLQAQLTRKEVRSIASEALAIALDLEAASSCSTYRGLLGRAQTYGDVRSLRTLRKLAYDRGCGLLKLRDCYPCLRGTRALADAIESARSRPAPSF